MADAISTPSDFKIADGKTHAPALARFLDVRLTELGNGDGMNWGRSMLAVALGGTLGCVMRWFFQLLLNRYFPAVPPGTLAANLIGCYVIGVALAVFAVNPTLPPEWRLFVMTGFCGGLTTFSTFSAEVVVLLQSGRMAWALSTIVVHVIGSLLMTFAGIATVTWVKS